MASSPSVAQPRKSASDDDIKRRVGKKLQKKKQRESSLPIDLPERLLSSDESDDDDSVPTQGPPMFMNMNQSIFGLIAAAGSRVDFNDRFDGSSSDEEEGDRTKERDSRAGDLSKTSVLHGAGRKKEKHHRKRLSEHKLLRSLPMLPKLRSRSKRQSSRLSTTAEEANESSEASDIPTPPTFTLTRHDSRQAPMMSRMLEAKAEMSSRPSFDLDRLSSDISRSSDGELPPLAKKLMEIFEFDEPEAVIEGRLHPPVAQGHPKALPAC